MKRILIIAVLLALAALPGLADQDQNCRSGVPTWHPGYWWSYQAQGLVEDLGAWGEIYQITRADLFERYVLGVRRIDDEDFYVASTIIWTDRGPLVRLRFYPADTMEHGYPLEPSALELRSPVKIFDFPLWVGKRWIAFPEHIYRGVEYPALEAEVVGIEEADVPAGKLPSFRIHYHYRQGSLSEWDLWYSPHLGTWVKPWDGGAKWLKLAQFWWFSPAEALDRTYRALEEAIEVFPDEAMIALALLIQYNFDPDRAWALLERP